MTVVWSENAAITFDMIVLYIEAKFGLISAKKFITKVDSVILSISHQPYIYKILVLTIRLEKLLLQSNALYFTK